MFELHGGVPSNVKPAWPWALEYDQEYSKSRPPVPPSINSHVWKLANLIAQDSKHSSAMDEGIQYLTCGISLSLLIHRNMKSSPLNL